MDPLQEKWNEMVEMAQDALILSRNTLLVNLRFLDAALSQFEMVPLPTGSLATDGSRLPSACRWIWKPAVRVRAMASAR